MQKLYAQHPFVRAVLLGLIAVVIARAPPLHLTSWIDRALFDRFTAWTAQDPPAEMLVVRFDEPGCIDAISQLAQRFHARLLITTLPTLREPEARNVLGLIAAPVASSTLLRNTG